MPFVFNWTREANKQYRALQASVGGAKTGRAAGTLKQVDKALALLADDPKHPSLKVHKYDSIKPPPGCGDVWEAYAQNRTPGAYRIFRSYGPEDGQITLIAITQHP